MKFEPMTQNELKSLNIIEGTIYNIEYINKDYYNGEETIEKGKATAAFVNDEIYFNVTDPYGMEKLVMKVRLLV